jgi:Rrf2 family protein
MRLSEGVEWGAHCTVALAMLPEGAVLPAARLAEYHDLPGPYLAKCLQALSGAGIVTSTQGRSGGYRLGRPATDITLLDVVVAIEGDDALFRCEEIRRNGPVGSRIERFSPVCGIAAAMGRAEQAWRAELATTSIDELARGVARKVPTDVMARSEQWLSAVIRRPGPTR